MSGISHEDPQQAPFGLSRGRIGAAAIAGRAVERALGLSTLNRLYRQLPSTDRPFWNVALETLGIRYELDGGGVDTIPATGPLVVVANHPYGGVDGLILLSLVSHVRPDVRLMGNYLLGRIPEIRPVLLPVDPIGDLAKRGTNAAAMRSAIRWVKSGGALVVFPAGEVAYEEVGNANRTDERWSAGVARIIQRTGADVVPVFFHGGNSRIFSLAGRIHPLLRTALLPRELLRQRGRTIRFSVGSKISSARLSRFEEPDRLASYLRVRTSALAADTALQPVARAKAHADPVAEPQTPHEIERETQALDCSRILFRNGVFDVLIARAHEVPRAMLEIGRLREIAFRRAGEGTDLSRDLDEFDAHYWHLFAWNRERREIAGAYRIGATDEIVPRAGIAGLYTSTLFRYDGRLLSQLDPALELGRAFVTPEYQRDYIPLLLLWKGIGAFVAANPRYRMLFGPVSISNTYQSLSRQILVRFLYATSYRRDLADLVVPRNPPVFLRHRGALAPIAGSIVRSLADVSTLLAEIESDRKGVPVLLRQYLKLNARLLGFNIDPSFGSVIDGLMLVDLTDVDRAILARYMGAEPAAAFLRHHGAFDRRLAVS